MSKHELQKRVDSMPIQSIDDLARLAEMFAKSGYFTDAKSAAQIGVKILAGREMGFGEFASVNGVHIISGRPAMGANLMAAAVKASAKYDYRVRTMQDDLVEIEFFQGNDSLGVSKFDLDDAKAAGTKNLGKFPRNMLFARAMSNGVRWYCPDVFMGSSVYTPEELGATVNDDGDVIDANVTVDVSDGYVTASTLDELETPQGTLEEPVNLHSEPDTIGEDGAEKLIGMLEKFRVGDPLGFANLMLDRRVNSLSDLSKAEGNDLYRIAKEAAEQEKGEAA